MLRGWKHSILWESSNPKSNLGSQSSGVGGLHLCAVIETQEAVGALKLCLSTYGACAPKGGGMFNPYGKWSIKGL